MLRVGGDVAAAARAIVSSGIRSAHARTRLCRRPELHRWTTSTCRAGPSAILRPSRRSGGTQASDVIIAFGPEDALKAATAATKTIPIVMAAIDYDPFALGYVTSLARPTGNVTGVVPRADRARGEASAIGEGGDSRRQQGHGVLGSPCRRTNGARCATTRQSSGIDLVGIELHDYPYDYARALAQAPPEHRGFLFVSTSPLFARDSERHRAVHAAAAGCRRYPCSGSMSTRAG